MGETGRESRFYFHFYVYYDPVLSSGKKSLRHQEKKNRSVLSRGDELRTAGAVLEVRLDDEDLPCGRARQAVSENKRNYTRHFSIPSG